MPSGFDFASSSALLFVLQQQWWLEVGQVSSPSAVFVWAFAVEGTLSQFCAKYGGPLRFDFCYALALPARESCSERVEMLVGPWNSASMPETTAACRGMWQEPSDGCGWSDTFPCFSHPASALSSGYRLQCDCPLLFTAGVRETIEGCIRTGEGKTTKRKGEGAGGGKWGGPHTFWSEFTLYRVGNNVWQKVFLNG
jgi:hypothetical protein